MTLEADTLENDAREETGLHDFGDGSHREGLERLLTFLNEEADLNEGGEVMLRIRLVSLLSSRLRVEDTYRANPSIDEEQVEGPVFVIGLPSTGTTALSQLVAADPQFRSLRLWESSSPCPPPESATEHTDPRIADAEAGLAMMNEMFPLMQTMHHEEATSPTECQDLLGMSFRTVHFDGFGHVPSYLEWVTDCDMRGTYQYHRPCSGCSSGIAHHVCGTSRPRCTCSPWTRFWRPIPTRSSSGATATPPRSWGRCAA